jgi:uncharacterized membrane protein
VSAAAVPAQETFMSEKLKKILRDHVDFSLKTPWDKITLISVVVGEIVIGLIVLYAVFFSSL